MDLRQLRGREIVKQYAKQIKRTDNGWLVPSQTSDALYRVGEDFVCSCPDSTMHKTTCKHAYAVRYYLQIEKQTPAGTQSERVRLTYGQAWQAYNAAQTQEITLFDELLKELVKEAEEPAYSFGRPRLSNRDMIFCAVQKAYSQLSGRRAVSLFGRANDEGRIKSKPHFNSVNNYLRDENITPMLYRLVTISALPLKSVESEFAVDSTGFRTTCFGQYAEQKYDLKREHKWLKAHACVGVKTNIVTAIEITDERANDCPQFAPLVQRTANGGFEIQEVAADKAYLSRQNYQIVDALGGQAYIPFKSNAAHKADGSLLWTKMFYYFKLHQDEFYQHYHKRSNVESTFSAIKRKFGDMLKGKTHSHQTNELLCKIIAYNITVLIHEMKELGITPEFEREQKVATVNNK